MLKSDWIFFFFVGCPLARSFFLWAENCMTVTNELKEGPRKNEQGREGGSALQEADIYVEEEEEDFLGVERGEQSVPYFK